MASFEDELLRSLHSNSLVSGLTHGFYRYPARMSPEFAQAAIRQFTVVGDLVLDPFAGGGTTVVEAIASGRTAIGVDINPLATFVTLAKTTPLSTRDMAAVIECLSRRSEPEPVSPTVDASSHDSRLLNFPVSLVPVVEGYLEQIEHLDFPRQRQFARCVLLRAGQKTIDAKRATGRPEDLSRELHRSASEMAIGLQTLVRAAREHGVKKNQMTRRRSVLLRSAVGLEEDRNLQIVQAPQLVLTSPPYPAVHVLYHRWQVEGRRETPGPYWIIGQPDGYGESHFTMGSRSEYGISNYFQTLTKSLRSVRSVIAYSGVIVQLVSFSDVETQLPRFLRAMEEAGFREDATSLKNRSSMWRSVPNRNWYNRIDSARKPARELLLVHLPN